MRVFVFRVCVCESDAAATGVYFWKWIQAELLGL